MKNYNENHRKLISAVTIFSLMLLSSGAQAKIFDGSVSPVQKKHADITYSPVPAVAVEQSQLVYYYPENINVGPINIYVDKEFHTALLPGEYTAICVSKGLHTLGAAIKDAPLYQQKYNSGIEAQFEGGVTYFVRTTKNLGLSSEAVIRKDAERELQYLRKNSHVINRASSVQNCSYVREKEGVTLITDAVFFEFAGSSYSQLMPESKTKLATIIDIIKKSGNISHISLTGFTDRIGNAESNRRLSKARAEAIRQELIKAGISGAIIRSEGNGIASTAGGCNVDKNVGCNKESRRVDIIVKNN